MAIKTISLIEILSEIMDNRRAEGKRHPLPMLLIITIILQIMMMSILKMLQD